ncbi:hypothetical protein BHV55_04935 [Bacillus sp. RZ2MS9]|uniref:hypothetical protein n=1 Tax=Bacillus sp. RZ2MS9 TaxID=1806216 RepID=UPI0008A5F9AC|nr:hypothetical protein [Bacillus sp. RZ2MS9]QIZ41042.1 hypothetical protein BHV55_04935 [Bacillus sp. RZ2MS9]
MKKPVSVFIMDVTNSTSKGDWNELTRYLKEWEGIINSWSHNEVIIKAKHRMGDEILLVGDHYATAYIIAFYMEMHWKFNDQKPYFGVSFGCIEEDLEHIEIDWWNHPLIKRARIANEKIKNNPNRDTSVIFDICEEVSNFERGKQFQDTMNLLVQLQNKLMDDQTKQQRLISSLYTIFKEQKKIAQELNKTSSTISSHFRKGDSEMIFKIFEQLQDSLVLTETINSQKNVEEIKSITNVLNNIIREHIRRNLDKFYPELNIQGE